MPFDESLDPYRLSTWRGLPILSGKAPVADLHTSLPDFELRPLGIPPHDNPRMRLIVRMPTAEDPYERPVAAVSDRYDLLQYKVVAGWLRDNLLMAGFGDAEASYDITRYGERLRLRIPLNAKTVEFFPEDGTDQRYRPELEVVNSVDRSSAFSVTFRWRRLVCLNGMFTKQTDRLRSVHHIDWSRPGLVKDFLEDRLSVEPVLVTELARWRRRRVDPKSVQGWIEGWLRKEGGWSSENCARMWAILETGYDGEVLPPKDRFKKHPISAYKVGQHKRVPGIRYPVETAYDVAQILTWITSNQRSVEFQTEGTEDIPRLMRAMCSATDYKV